MSDIAFSMSLDNTDRLRFTSSSCQEDYKKGSISLAAFTILYSTICAGLVLNNLIGVYSTAAYYDTTHKDETNRTGTNQDGQYEKVMLPIVASSETIVTKVMYIVLITQILLLIAISFLLPKGIFKKKEALIMTWILVTFSTIIYAGVVIIRDFQLEGQTAAVYTKTILYVIFLMTETILMKHPIKAFRKARLARLTENRRNTARYNSRNPEQAIITISGRLAPADPDSLFKLPTYEEATVNSSSPQNTDEDHLDKPPPNKPPDYSP